MSVASAPKLANASTEERVYQPADRLADDPLSAYREHLDRYEFAARRVQSQDSVLDAACGSGYGTEMLARVAAQVTGLEIDVATLDFARRHHQLPNIEFVPADLSGPVPVGTGAVGRVVSFETLEHLREQDHLLREFARVLAPGGELIISTPIRQAGPATLNPHHLQELTEPEFRALIEPEFEIAELLYQGAAVRMGLMARILKSLRTVALLRWVKQQLTNAGAGKAVSGLTADHQYTPITAAGSWRHGDPYIIIAVCRKRDPACAKSM